MAEGFVPPQAVRNNAKRGLELRREHGRQRHYIQHRGHARRFARDHEGWRNSVHSGVARRADVVD